jgi:beta-glucosidase
MIAPFSWHGAMERLASISSNIEQTRMSNALRRWLMVAFALVALGAAGEQPPYRDPSRSIDERVSDLLSRMTLEEKVAQLQGLWNRKTEMQLPDGRFNPAAAKALIGQGIGEISRPSEIGGPPNRPLRGPREHAQYVNDVQKWLIEQTRLGIPALFHDEALHGLTALRGTHFPVPIGLASTFDPGLVERVMSVAAKEARRRGSQHVLSPVVDLGRDPRWGRIEETYGEDPYLVSRMGVAAVRGYQGRSLPLAPDKVFATLKHYAGHGSHEGGINTAPPLVAERLLRAELFVPFEAAVKEAGAYSVMPSYNEVDGVPSHVNEWLLEQVLRREWGFQGFVAADYFAIEQLVSRHHVAGDKASAARQALSAGVDLELPDPYGYPELTAMVKDGRVAESLIDRSVARVLRAKFLAGLFEHPYVDPDEAERVTNTPESQALALETARRSLVLLKNDGSLLPLERQRIKTLAIIGPNAKGVHLGGYSRDPGRGVDVLSGITTAAGPGIKVVYAEGVRITEHEANWNSDKVVFGDPPLNRTRIQEATKVARQADVIIAIVGTNESVAREAYADEHLGDVADLGLMSQQQDLVDALLSLGKPVIVVLVNGRPLAIPELAERVPAILETWYAGQEGGTAIGEALFGDTNPGGKLPVTIPRHVGQLPVYYNRRPTSFRAHLDLSREPLWPFGHGLSYTTFAVANLAVSPASIGPGGRATVTVDVTNTGTRRGDEVVQLYLRDVVSSVTRPTKELRGFERVTLAPGEKRTVTFVLGPEALSLVDRHMQRVVEPGRFEVMVGASSSRLITATLDVAEPPR